MPSFLSFSKSILAIVSFFAILALPSQVRAFTFYVDTMIDSATACSITPGGACSLRGAVIAANANPGPDTIRFARPGTYQLNLTTGTTDEAYGDLDFTNADPTTIIGLNTHDTVIDAVGLDRAFDIDPAAKIRVRNITVKNGTATNGGSVFNEGDINMANVIFDTHVATDGGTVYNMGLASMRNVSISNAYASGSGGAVYNEGQLHIADSQIDSNTASSGAGISNNAGAVTITRGTVISNNTAASYGGGIRNYNAGMVDIDGLTVISGNTASEGGAISENSSTTYILDSTISGNSATTAGGAVKVSYGTLSVINSTFLNNHGTTGGAIFQQQYSGKLFIDNSSFDSNTAIYGGAVYASSEADIRNTNFARNAVTTVSGSGGAIYVYGSTGDHFSLADSTVEANTSAGNGGGVILLTQGTSTISDTSFTNNSASAYGGAVQARPVHNPTIINASSFDNNSAQIGGAIAIDYAGAVVNESIIANNIASSYAGGLFNNTVAEVYDAQFTDNIAQTYIAGAIATMGTLEVSGTIFSGNESQGSIGGAIDVYSGTATIYDNTVFENNYSDSGGGALHVWASSVVNVVDTAFIGNVTDSYGGAIDNKGELYANNIAILNNQGWRGGGVSINNSSITEIENATISGNTAEWRGGGIYADATSATIDLTNVTIANNSFSNSSATFAQHGAGIYNPYTTTSTTISMLASIIADNTTYDGKASDFAGAYISSGSNVIKNSSRISNTTADPTDLWGQDPLLAALVVDVIPYRSVQALQSGSPAVDLDATCAVTFDQQYNMRPSGAACDSGAYEL